YVQLHRRTATNKFPATSTGVERVFSRGQQLLHFTRNRLSVKSVCSSIFLCLWSWSKHDLVGDKEFQMAVCEIWARRRRARERNAQHTMRVIPTSI
ncbi:hypothetical protein C8R46DRAFT_880231, partial [Mycena filopes]